MIKLKFDDFVKNIENYNEKYGFYVKSLPLKIDDVVCLFDAGYDIVESIDDFKFMIFVFAINDVLENLKEQTSGNIDINLCIEAINYYIQYDAFIDLDHTQTQ